jgi:copper transport protein
VAAAARARRAALLAFSRLATVCVGVLLLAGVYLAILRLPQLDDLWTTGYGRVLLVKIGLVALAFAWGGVHKLARCPVVARRRDACRASERASQVRAWSA